MITEAGKQLIAKYLLGQAPSYASFISFGCGAVEETDGSGNILPPDPNKQVMDFELIRVPITSRSYLVDEFEDEFGHGVAGCGFTREENAPRCETGRLALLDLSVKMDHEKHVE